MTDDQEKAKSNAQTATQRLRDLIFSGELAAGSDHLETELAKALGMSRTPVREALVVLEGQGLVELRPRKGVRIRPVSASDMAEIYDVLTELESMAAADAAVRDFTAEDLSGLSNAIDNMDAALIRQDRAAWAEADDAFHSELVRLGGNSRVQSIVAMLSDQVRRARLVTLHMRPKPTRSNTDHRQVLNAIRDRDPQTARTLHRAHRAAAKAMLIDLLTKHHLNSL